MLRFPRSRALPFLLFIPSFLGPFVVACADDVATVAPPIAHLPEADAGPQPGPDAAEPDAAQPDASPPPVVHDPVVHLSAETLTFEHACATSAPAQTVTVSNAGDRGFAVQAAILADGPFVVSPPTASVPPHGDVTFTITPGAISASGAADFAPHRWDGHLELRTDIDGDSPRLVALEQHVNGALLDFDRSVKTFPDTRVDATSELPLTIRNLGSRPTTVTLSARTNLGEAVPYFTTEPAAPTIGPNESVDVKIRFTPGPDDRASQVDFLRLEADGASCAYTGPDVRLEATGIERLKQIAASDYTCVLGTSGRMYCWYFADPFSSNRNVFTVPGIVGATQIAVGWQKYCALLADKTVACAGPEGTSGYPTPPAGPPPYVFPGLTDAVGIASGAAHTCALHSGGQVQCWGNGSDGRLGDGSTATTERVATVQNLTDATMIASGDDFVCALHAGGTVACWGQGATGTLGDGTEPASAVPVEIAGLSDIDRVAAGGTTACAHAKSGKVSCWGLGAPSKTKKTPTEIGVFASPDTALALSRNDSCVLVPGAGSWCWGGNAWGALEPIAKAVVETPTVLPNDRGYVGWVSAGEGPCAIDRDGAAYCWDHSVTAQRLLGF